MRVLLAPNAFKESLTPREAAEAMAGRLAALPGVEIDRCPLSDGGEGFLEAVTAAGGGTIRPLTVPGPLGEPVEAAYGRLGDALVVELALAAGLAQVPPDRRDPRVTSTYGVGALVAAAWAEAPFARVVLGLGGSATVDGGAGLLQALGVRLLDAGGKELPRGGAALARVARIDLSEASPALRVRWQVACDVENPLVGELGAARVYGPQKGASPAVVQELEAALTTWSEVLEAETGRNVAAHPGCGAAGGVAAPLVALGVAELAPGFDLVAGAVDLPGKLAACDLVITGEGRLDAQSFYGKAGGRLATLCRAAGVPLVALCGGLDPDGVEALDAAGGYAFSLVDRPMALPDAQRQAAELLGRACVQIVGLFDRGRRGG